MSVASLSGVRARLAQLVRRPVPAFVVAAALAAVAVVADPFPPYWGGGTGTAVHYAPVAWPADGAFIAYTRLGTSIVDKRDTDPSNGGTSPQGYVNVSSGCTDQSSPSVYYAYDSPNQILFFRWRVQAPPHNYATGPNTGGYSSSSPWSSALWTVFMDTNGDGYRDFAVHLDGSSGSPSAAIDRVAAMWSTSKSQSLDYINDPAIHLLRHNPAAFVDGPSGTDRLLNFHGALTPNATWANGSSETEWDYGTTRATLRNTGCGEYFIDYQIPLAMLNATGVGGPQVTPTTPMSLFFGTANSLNNPIQKDAVVAGDFIADPARPVIGGDIITPSGGTVLQPTVTSVTATGCGSTTLTANVFDTLNLDRTTSVSSVMFQYYADSNADGVANDSGSVWTNAAAGTAAADPVGKWTATWNSTALPQGQYLLAVKATDGQGNVAFSQFTSQGDVNAFTGGAANNFPNAIGALTARMINSCGAAGPSISKTVSPSFVAAGGTVTFTISVANTLGSAITVSSITDTLPAGFAYASTTGTAIGAPSTSPSAGATGAITWTFAPVSIPASTTRTLIFTATASTTAGTYTNSVSAATSYGTLSSGATDIGVGSPALTIGKSASVASATPGDPVAYTITYANDSAVSVTNAVITDVLPTGLDFVSATGGGTYSSGTRTVTWNIGSLSSGSGASSVVLNTTITTPYPGAAAIPIVNTASIASTQTSASSSSVPVYVNAPRAQLSIQKEGDVSQVAAGGSVTYTLTYANTGASSASGVTITDVIPAGWAFVSATGGGTNSSGTVTWNIGSLAASASGSVQLVLQASNPFTGSNPSTNTAAISATGVSAVTNPYSVAVTKAASCPADGVTYYFHNTTTNVGVAGPQRVANTTAVTGADTGTTTTATSTGSANVVELARFYLDPTVTSQVTFAGSLSSTIYIDRANGQGVDVTGTVYDYDPASGVTTSLGALTTGFNGSAKGLFTFTIPVSGALQAGHRLLWVYTFASSGASQTNQLYAEFGGRVTNPVSGGTTDALASSTFCTTVPANPTLNVQVDKLVAAPGDALTYTIRFGNAGQTNMTASQIVNTLPDGVTFVSATLNGAAATAASTAGQQRTFNVKSTDTATVGQISGGQSGTLVISATATAPFTGASDTLTNTASLSSTQTSAVVDSTSTAMQRPSVTITKSADRTLLVPGDTVTYSLNVLNAGPGTAANVTVADTLPATAYFTYVLNSAKLNGVTISPDPVGGGVLSRNIGSLTAGSTATVTFSMLVASSGVPSGTTAISNTATVSDGGSSGTRSSNASALTISTNPNLTLTKASSPSSGPVAAGSAIAYTLTVTNIGSGDATGVMVRDIVPSNTTYSAGSLVYAGAAQTDVSGDDNSFFDGAGNRAVFNVGTLAAGSSRILTYTVTVDSPLSNGTTTLSSTATATASNAATKQASSSITASAAPVLTLVKSAPASVPYPLTTLASGAAAATSITVASAAAISIGDVISVGGTTSTVTNVNGTTVTLGTAVTGSGGAQVLPTWEYRLAFANTGTSSATSVVVTDVLPAGLTFIDADSGGGNSGGTVTWNLGTVAAGATGTLRVRVRPGSATTYANSATLASAELSTVTSNSTSTATGSLTVDKTTTTPSGSSSGNATTATYVITLQNQSPGTAANSITVRDDLAAGFTYASTVSIVGATASGSPAVGDASPTWSGLSIPANSTATITFTALVSNVSPGTYQNYLTVTSGNANVLGFDALATTAEDVAIAAALGTTGIVGITSSIAPGATLTIAVTDPDLNTNPASAQTAAVTVTNTRTNEFETLTLTETGANTGVFSGTLATNAVATAGTNNSAPLNVAGGDTVRASYNDALTSTGGTATVTADGSVVSSNQAPVVAMTGAALAYTENAAATAVDTGLTVTDADSANLAGATVSITANYVNGEDILAFTTQNGISGSFDAATAVMTLSGSATVANYQTALRSVTYRNTSDTPSTSTRTVSVVANDGTANSNTASRNIAVTAVNDPPVVAMTASALAFTEGNSATAVDTGLTVTDLDSANLASATVAITANYVNGEDVLAVANQNGITGSFNAASGVLTLTGSATLANYQTALRSVTYANSSTNPSTSARTVSVVANDGTSNSNTAARSITVAAVNQAPVVAMTASALAFTEGNSATAIDTGLTVTDADSANLASATVSITANYVNGEDVLAVANQNGITGSFNAASGVLTLTGSATLANYQTALRSVTYANNSTDPSTSARTVSVVANDGTANSNTATRSITVAAVNNAPVVTMTASALAFTEGNSATAIDTGLTVTDADSANLASATVSITANYVTGEDVLAVANQNGITGSFNATTGVLTLSGSATVANYQTALRSVTYANSSTNPSTSARTVSVVANDGTANSNTATRSITVAAVNQAPVVAMTASALAFTEGNSATAIDTGLTVTDGDSTNLASATVSITANYVDGEDVLAVANQNGITGSFNTTTGVLTLSGSATVANYQTALRSVTYANSSTNPSTSVRTVSVVANDGTANSNTATRSITVAAVNNAPVVAMTASALAFTEGNSATAIDTGLTVTDADSTNLASATVSITANYVDGEDVLAVANQNGITGSFNATTGVLTLTGSATVANYQTALRSVTYANSSTNPSTLARTVSVVANDGTANSNTATRSITVAAVNQAPVVAMTASALAFTEGNSATAIDTGLTVTDGDSTNLASATVSITANYVNGEDVLAVANQNGITGSFNATTGVLTLSGSATVANYQTALRSVTYANSSTNPSTLARTVSVVANDGTANSNTATRNITVAATNNPPVVAMTASALAFTEGNSATAIDTGLTVTDADSTNLASATVSITANYVNGEDVLAVANQNGITGSFNAATGVLTLTGSATLANYQTALRSVTYANSSTNPSTSARTISVVANDATANSNTATRSITVAAVNNPPVVAMTASALSFAEGGSATAIDTGLTVTDADSTNLANATVSITANYVDGEDVLAVAPQNGITGAFNTTTGVLTLSGSATVANYQTALRSVTYANSSTNPSTLARTVSVVANDGAANSNTATRSINVGGVNDAPVVTMTASALAFTEGNSATAIDTGLTVTDADSANLAGATVTISTNYVNGEDVLAVATQNGITGSFNATTGVLTLSGSATVANYQTALRSVTYANSSTNPSTSARTVSVVANDGTANSNTATRGITVAAVNNAPVVAMTASALAFTEGNSATAIDTGLTVTDADSANLASARVSITGNFVTGEDVLGFAPQNGITGSFNATTGVLTLSGSATVANYQTALRSVTYANSSTNPSTPARTVSVFVNDGALNSNTATRGITVAAVNDPPVVAMTFGPASFTSSGSPTVVDPGMTVTDVDSPNLTGATVSITSNHASGEDVLGFTNQSGITGSFNATSGVLTLSGSATLASYRNALRSVTYWNSNADPSTATRTVSVAVTDGALNSNTATRNVTVGLFNAAPVVTMTAAALNYAAGAMVDEGLTVTDADSPSLTSARMSITGNFTPAEDTLAFTPQNGIIGTFDATTGVLTLTGSATVEHYQIALRSVTYTNVATPPTLVTRTVSLSVTDGAATSNTATRDITLTVAPSSPSGPSGPATQGPTLDQPAALVVDEDSAASTVTLTGLGAGPSGGAVTVAAQAADASLFSAFSINYASPGSTASLAFTPAPDAFGTTDVAVTVTGADGKTKTRTFALTITAVNDRPTLDAISNRSVTIGTAQAVSLAGIRSGAANEAQVLTVTAVSSNPAVVPAPAVSYATPGATGTLTLTAAGAGTAIITVTVDDGQAVNASVTRTFTVSSGSGINTPPTITPIANISVIEGNQLPAVGFTVGDAETPASGLTVTVRSLNGTLIPAAAAVLAGSDADRSLILVNAPNKIGTGRITVTVSDGELSASTAFDAVVRPQWDYYLPDGWALPNVATDVRATNPHAFPAPVRLTFLKPSGEPGHQLFDIPAITRWSARLFDVPAAGGGEVSTFIRSIDNLPLLVERTMTWEGDAHAGSAETALESTNLQWYFAEGAQAALRTNLIIANPNDAEVAVTVTFFLDAGGPVSKVYKVGALARRTLAFHDIPALAGRSFGMLVESSLPVAAERTMYLDDPRERQGGHSSAGVPFPSTQWYFAEGSDWKIFQTYMLLLNPGATAANVRIEYHTMGGTHFATTHVVNPRARLTVDTLKEEPKLDGQHFWMSVTSDQPVVAERSMYWDRGGAAISESHNSHGVVAPSRHWSTGDARVGGPQQFSTFVLIGNPTASTATLTVTIKRGKGEDIVSTRRLGPLGRDTINVNTAVPALSNESFWMLIDSDVPILAERSQYWNPDVTRGSWSGGTNTFALPVVPADYNGCAYNVGPVRFTAVPQGARLKINVGSTSRCTYTAVPDSSWLRVVSGDSGSGVSSVVVRVDPNPSPSVRTGVVTIAGQAVTVVQDAAPATTVGDPQMTLDAPLAGARVGSVFRVTGWAVDLAAMDNTSGIGAVDVWAYPNPGSNTPAIYLGAAEFGLDRPDIEDRFGDRTRKSGFSLTVRGLAAGAYQIVAFPYSTVTSSFSQARAATVTVASDLRLVVDTPGPGPLTLPANVAGWATDATAQGETGIDAVHIWAYPAGGGPAIFAGEATYGHSRPDVAAALNNPSSEPSGFSLPLRSLDPGKYQLVVFARRTGVSSFDLAAKIDIEIAGVPRQFMVLDTPTEREVVGPSFDLSGWALDLRADSGTGVDVVHVWAYNESGGAGMFLGAAKYGMARDDVAQYLGERAKNSAYTLSISSLPPGTYRLVAFAHSAVSGLFDQSRTRIVTVTSAPR